MSKRKRIHRKWRATSTDYKAGELFCHAQSCIWLLGRSDLATLLLANKDPHSDFAATLRNVDYDEFIARKKEPAFKDGRQAAKAFVFAKPGAGGDATICIQQRKQGPDTPCPNGPVWIESNGILVRGYKGTRFCILLYGDTRCGVEKVTQWGHSDKVIPPTCVRCLEASKFLGQKWKGQWWENPRYFDYQKDQLKNGYSITPAMVARWPWWAESFRPGTRLAPGEIAHHYSGMIRRVENFSTACNTLFQNLLAQITLTAYWRVQRECRDKSYIVHPVYPSSKPTPYDGGPSPLLGSRAPGFLHDEILAMHPPSQWREAGGRVGYIMEDTMAHYLPDVAPAVEAKPAGMLEWNKNAEPVFDEDGRLQLWLPKTGNLVTPAGIVL